jgi:hypothetical protein
MEYKITTWVYSTENNHQASKRTLTLDRTENNDHGIQNNNMSIQYGK